MSFDLLAGLSIKPQCGKRLPTAPGYKAATGCVCRAGDIAI
jgi:hypothetical protein